MDLLSSRGALGGRALSLYFEEGPLSFYVNSVIIRFFDESSYHFCTNAWYLAVGLSCAGQSAMGSDKDRLAVLERKKIAE